MSEPTTAQLRLVLSSVLSAVVDPSARPVLLSVVGGERAAVPPAAAAPARTVVVFPRPRRALDDAPLPRGDGPSAA